MTKLKTSKVILIACTLGTPFLCNLTTSCSVTYKYPDRSLICMGDSLTWGMTPSGGRMLVPYPKALRDKLGFGQYYNYGICGSTISNGQKSFDPMVDRISTMPDKGNIVIFWGGTNDYRFGCSLGSKGDTDKDTVYGALDYISQQLLLKYSGNFIMYITPLPTTVQPISYELSDICEAMKYTCSKYSIPLLDLYTTSGFEKEMTQPYSDGIHPTQAFILTSIVPKIYGFIEEHVNIF